MSSNSLIDVIIVEDHPLFRLGICSGLKQKSDTINVLDEVDCGEKLFKSLKQNKPNLILLDIVLPDMSGIEISRRLREEYPNVNILIFSTEVTESVIVELLEIGIDGFISKSEPIDVLIQAIESVNCGITYYGKDVASIIHDVSIAKSGKNVHFTEREIEIIRLCAEGLTGREIAEKLFISYRTVETHKTNIFQKLEINNSIELVKYALRHSIISI